MKKTILTVDDSGSMRQMLAYSLTAAGFNVIQAVNGFDGLNQARLHKMDLVLTDQNMPVMDGLTLIKNLRSLDEYLTTPILMLTTENNHEIKEMARVLGANGFVDKPFDPDRFIHIIQEVLGINK